MSLFTDFEDEVIADVARRVKKTGRYTETAELMAKSMREQGYSPAQIQKEVMKHLRANKEYQMFVAENTKAYKEEVREIINQTVKEAKKAGDDLVAQAGEMAWNSDLSMWSEHGVDLKKPNSMSQLKKAFALQTANELRNFTRTLGFKNANTGTEGILSAYQRELDLAVIKVSTGTFSYDQVVKDCVERLAKSGLRHIDYESGRTYQLDTAVRNAVRTGCSQLAGKIMEENLKSSGQDLVITSQHLGSRPEHAPWQNKVFSYSGKSIKYPDFVSSTGYGTVTGLKGANCMHDFYPFWEGASVIPKDLKEPGPVMINGKEYTYYQCTQKQRSMERDIRAIKREINATEALGMDSQELHSKLKRKVSEYRRFSDSANMKPKINRLRVASETKAENNAWIPKKTSSMRRDPSKFRQQQVITEDKQEKTFSKAKTQSEVLEIGKILTKTGEFSTSGLHLNTINGFMEAMYNVKKRFGQSLNIKGLKAVKSGDSRYRQGSYDPISKVVSLKGGNSATALSTYGKNAEKFFANGWNASKDPYGTFYHEIGHSVWDDLPSAARSEIRGVYQKAKHDAYEKWMGMGGSRSGKSQADVFGKELSRYAIENEQEFFAEAFSQIMSGRMRPVSRNVNSILSEYYTRNNLADETLENDVKSSKIKLDLQFFAKKHKSKKVPNDDPLWDSLVRGNVEQQMEEEIFEWEHGGYDYLIEIKDRYTYEVLSKKKKRNIHE